MIGLWQSTVPCGEMLEGEMCWTLQAGDYVREDTSEPQLWKEHSSRLDGLIICKVPSWEEQGTRHQSSGLVGIQVSPAACAVKLTL